MSDKRPSGTIEPAIAASWKLAQRLRSAWEPRWQRLNDLAMPYRPPMTGGGVPQGNGANRGQVYDDTGMVALDEFASRLQTGIMPNGIEWAAFSFSEGEPTDQEKVELALKQTQIFDLLARSNLAAEMKDSFMDMGGYGTHCIRVMPGPWQQRLRFQAISQVDCWITPGPDGHWADVHVRYRLPRYAVAAQWPDAELPEDKKGEADNTEVEVIDSWVRDLDAWKRGQPERWLNQLHMKGKRISEAKVESNEGACPYIVGRWGKNAGELYGIGQGMMALPSMEVCNDLVHDALANARLAMAGMWQAEDDGVMNPWSVQLIPGTIIPIAPGSKGLQPLSPQGGRTEIATLVLKDSQHNIRKILFNEQLGPREGTPTTAFEIQERMNELARAIGPAYERVWQETVVPLLARCVRLLKEQGHIKFPALGENKLRVVSASAFVRSAAFGEVRKAGEFMQGIAAYYGPQALAMTVSLERYSAWAAQRMGIPANLLFDPAEKAQAAEAVMGAMAAGALKGGQPGMPGAQPGGAALLSPTEVAAP